MLRVFTRGALPRAGRPLLGVLAAPEPPLAFCCCALRVPPSVTTSSHARLSTSSLRRASPSAKEPEGGAPEQRGGPEQRGAVELDPLQDPSIGLVQRFKKTFKQYGKVMIPVHLLTSTVWFSAFYYAAMKGVNVVPFLEMVGLPESLLGMLRDSSSGYALTAYAMYKIATPARYTVTLGGTSLSVQYLRKHGYLPTPPPVTEYIQDKMEETKEKLTEKMEETKERISGKMEETKEKLTEKMEETKDKFSEKLQETKERVSEGKAFFRKKGE